MNDFFRTLRERSFPVHVMVFLAMILPSAGLYFVAGSGAAGLVWVFIGVIVIANLLAMMV